MTNNSTGDLFEARLIISKIIVKFNMFFNISCRLTLKHIFSIMVFNGVSRGNLNSSGVGRASTVCIPPATCSCSYNLLFSARSKEQNLLSYHHFITFETRKAPHHVELCNPPCIARTKNSL